MRLCRYQHNGTVEAGLFLEDRVANLGRVAEAAGLRLPTPKSPNLLDYLPPNGKTAQAARQAHEAFQKLSAADQKRLSQSLTEVKLLVPIPEPKKVILLAGNYASHIIEGGGNSVERQHTFPYFFWKPPSTTLTASGDPIRIPKVSPNHVDWEIELGVIIGQSCRHVSEKEALKYVAGYTVCNDVSDRRFQINPKRVKRDKDSYFDWLHGKWHDTFLPTGPCVRSADSLPDPQKMRLTLKVNGKVMQDASTAQMIFSVAALVAIMSTFMTLEAGDLIVTGTPSGVGAARKPQIFLKAKDIVEAEIEGIGLLRNPVENEK